eukprot:TRINITY_DN31505_c0_g1_i1.p1 TRINITY_DN31505_c0_g1~~TRINITY_DN31505_c0_g1_i1.p1  ORF type:complete len:181 (-),score=11.66 TRINITY_DN31505_c0_g1_i1:109-651(-)
MMVAMHRGRVFGASFKEFLRGLYSTYYETQRIGDFPKQNTDRLDFHFCPQTMLCGMQQGFAYDYVLKHELIADWYPNIIKALNYTEVVSSGWPENNKCFLNTPQMPCDGPTLGYQQHNKGKEKQKNARTNQLHSRGSNEFLLHSYDEETAKLVTEMFMSDLTGLEYPPWDGRAETFRLTF